MRKAWLAKYWLWLAVGVLDVVLIVAGVLGLGYGW